VPSILSDPNRVGWRLPTFTVLGAFILFSVGPADLSVVLYVFSVLIVSLFLLDNATRRRRCQPILVLVVFWVVSAGIVKNYSAVRDECRWLAWSHVYKREILAQSESAAGELKHVEWDGWGFPGAGNTIVYLVFDPTDSLGLAAKIHQSGMFSGIPCGVVMVHRLQTHWYSVRFYTQQVWAQDCGEGWPRATARE
jgi:hypothetical protein